MAQSFFAKNFCAGMVGNVVSDAASDAASNAAVMQLAIAGDTAGNTLFDLVKKVKVLDLCVIFNQTASLMQVTLLESYSSYKSLV